MLHGSRLRERELIRGSDDPNQHFLRPYSEESYSMTSPMIQPIVALVAGILILVRPQLLNFIVAIYLIVIGILGLVRH